MPHLCKWACWDVAFQHLELEAFKALFEDAAMGLPCCSHSLKLLHVKTTEWLVWVKGAKFARYYKRFELSISRAGLLPKSFIFLSLPWCLATAVSQYLAGNVLSLLNLKCLFSGLNSCSYLKVIKTNAFSGRHLEAAGLTSCARWTWVSASLL